MAHRCGIWILLLVGGFAISDVGGALPEPGASIVEAPLAHLTTDQRALVEFALERFEAQGLEVPDLQFVFHESLLPCDLHKGRYHRDRRLVEMCSMDKHTMLHELAHAWANQHMTPEQMESFVAANGLDSWNDPDHAWARRGTEQVAETIAWGLTDEPRHMTWVEYREDGTRETTYRILPMDVEVEVFLSGFKAVTGLEPVFRDPAEWSAPKPASFSPEVQRSGA